ncbi:heme exporter protein CcmD [Paenirhodobacter populi]|uniref:heme exporter protein CcmD n=1 Tax=Paenirhodobacter populi TaxID=2306993 RepID=UPI000FE336EC|nr:heme exporter protein CcmD [Sinirhodobacter populi]RWR06032.1 heme exporter protein CcmD [Sinirhodobacter populi]
MMPDLGRYTMTVLSAWGATLALLAVLVGVSLWQAARAKRALGAQEERMRKDG